MTRKLLPYEYDLIDVLGVTKEEYLEFLAVQAAYEDPKQGTALDIRNEPTAIVLFIIGVLLQVASVLLMPKPSVGGGERQTREQRFSPRFGFNSTQELAKYTDVVGIVYTDKSSTGNKTGGVRVSGALLWSAVRSYGSNQFLQMLMLLTGGKITSIDPSKSAFGQTAVRDLMTQNKWVYFNDNATGVLRWADELDDNQATDPTKYGTGSDNPYRLQPGNDTNTRVDGFSQAYSPSSANVFGVYSPVPINVRVYLRDESGNKGSRALGITATGWPTGVNKKIAKGDELKITINSTESPSLDTDFDSDLQRTAFDARRSFASVFDEGGIFKFGSARFRVTDVKGVSTDEGKVVISLVCIEAGHSPSIAYSADEVTDLNAKIVDSPEYTKAQQKLNKLLDLDDRNTDNSVENIRGLPSDQKFVVTDAQSFLRSKQIYEVVLAKALGITVVSQRQGTYLRWKFVRNLTEQEIGQLEDFVELEKTVKIDRDALYFIKALTRVEDSLYNTVTACHIVDIAIKVQVFKRISGRQRKYGSKQRKGYIESDNGIQLRTALFLMHYRVAGEQWETVPGIFAVRRAAEQDNYVYIKFKGGATAQQWQFRLEAIMDPLAEIQTNKKLRGSDGSVDYFYIQNAGSAKTISLDSNHKVFFTGLTRASMSGMPPLNTAPDKTNEWDLFSLDADTQLQMSMDRGPEFSVTAVTEQLRQKFDDTKLYKDLALIGFNVFSGKSLQDMRSFSAFVTGGRPVRRLNTSTLTYPAKRDGPTSYAPDIFLDTVLDPVDGIANYARVEGVDTVQLAKTKRFCIANKLYMDTLIADQQNWRQFWASAAPFSLLEFARIGGRETLVPALPYNEKTGAIDRRINVSALFNQGNILEDSYKEEFIDYDSNTQDIIATVIYRSLDSNGIFAVNRSISVQRTDADEANVIRQDFDASAFVTNEDQAIKIGKLMCNTRHYVRTAIEFKTYPTTSPIAPGAYIYVDVGQNEWDNIKTGVIGPGGKLNAPVDNKLSNGTKSFLLYKPGAAPYATDATVTDYVASSLSNKEGYLYVIGNKVKRRRVFRVTEVQMDEEGEVTVRASIYPCDSDDNSLIADFGVDDPETGRNSIFTIQR